ncbi:hypothetical protein AAFF_G00276570 [Aldrovandia affinis]|uniref:Uncharacterized protein n=1 Tax=Aldrovandia affinis TaxID=143900 RepID=A0AAD7RAE6_9TELE|nr:hypothetical protein AAFF_G00276570 [Aldrovandia affinis]
MRLGERARQKTIRCRFDRAARSAMGEPSLERGTQNSGLIEDDRLESGRYRGNADAVRSFAGVARPAESGRVFGKNTPLGSARWGGGEPGAAVGEQREAGKERSESERLIREEDDPHTHPPEQ